MARLPDNEGTLRAQAFVLEAEAASEAENPIYQIAPDSRPLTDAEKSQLQAYGLKHKGKIAFNTLTVKKLPSGMWVARRASWLQDWSSPKANLAEVFTAI